MTVLVTIGEFSRMTYLSVKALRHYHDVGVADGVVAGGGLDFFVLASDGRIQGLYQYGPPAR